MVGEERGGERRGGGKGRAHDTQGIGHRRLGTGHSGEEQAAERQGGQAHDIVTTFATVSIVLVVIVAIPEYPCSYQLKI